MVISIYPYPQSSRKTNKVNSMLPEQGKKRAEPRASVKWFFFLKYFKSSRDFILVNVTFTKRALVKDPENVNFV